MSILFKILGFKQNKKMEWQLNFDFKYKKYRRLLTKVITFDIMSLFHENLKTPSFQLVLISSNGV